ncbi:hypothetical protein [Segetibacter koreensis]|uniref:hypothetical protein n=1 Tax=Segetibacter koreensis TaxID=398037 RepID=UPI0003800DE1|nr:hypothetical protein [Segetibacter koreensis]
MLAKKDAVAGIYSQRSTDQIHNPEFSLFNRVNEIQHNNPIQIEEKALIKEKERRQKI